MIVVKIGMNERLHVDGRCLPGEEINIEAEMLVRDSSSYLKN